MTRRQKITHLVVFDLLLRVELSVAMYFANAYKEYFTPVFAGVFFGLLIPTMLVSRVVVRRLDTRDV
ncbi:MAG: hypothetical protein GY953_51540, partial [bacterium]|nr:hypothetical protein [bacterium]